MNFVPHASWELQYHQINKRRQKAEAKGTIRWGIKPIQFYVPCRRRFYTLVPFGHR